MAHAHRFADFEISALEGGGWVAASPEIAVTVPDGGKIRHRNAIAARTGAPHVRVLWAELDGIRVYLTPVARNGALFWSVVMSREPLRAGPV